MFFNLHQSDCAPKLFHACVDNHHIYNDIIVVIVFKEAKLPGSSMGTCHMSSACTLLWGLPSLGCEMLMCMWWLVMHGDVKCRQQHRYGHQIGGSKNGWVVGSLPLLPLLLCRVHWVKGSHSSSCMSLLLKIPVDYSYT
jgi:hypothetical protein